MSRITSLHDAVNKFSNATRNDWQQCADAIRARGGAE
jgi:hypothetical protein